MGVLKYFQKICLTGTYFGLGVLKHFEPKIYKGLELYQGFIYNFLY